MNEDVRVSVELVNSFWLSRHNENLMNGGVMAKMNSVRDATPEQLIPDFKALRHILGRAIKELEKK